MSNLLDISNTPPPDTALVLLFGGTPTEHDVSRTSGSAVYEAVKSEYKHLELVGIDKEGRWISPDQPYSKTANKGGTLKNGTLKNALSVEGKEIDPTTFIRTLQSKHGENLVVFPALHGPGGEDGTIQTLLENLDVAYVGANPQASATCMDKLQTKQILTKQNLPVTPYLTITTDELTNKGKPISPKWDPPHILKPSSLGSSIGVTLVQTDEEIATSLEAIADLDDQFLLEPYLTGRELGCGLLQLPAKQHSYLASVVGEIVSPNPIYDYAAKYEAADYKGSEHEKGTTKDTAQETAQLHIPADIAPKVASQIDVASQIQELACKAGAALGIEGLARVDFFYDQNLLSDDLFSGGRDGAGGRADMDGIVINEVNTMPGFTPISLYPKLFEELGIKFPNLINYLVELALAKKANT